MPVFELIPSVDIHPPCGVILPKAISQNLIDRIKSRAGLWLSMHSDCTIIFGTETDIQLPWIKDKGRYIRNLGEGVFCPADMAPNSPPKIFAKFIAQTRNDNKLNGYFCLDMSDGLIVRDLSQAKPLETVDHEALSKLFAQ